MKKITIIFLTLFYFAPAFASADSIADLDKKISELEKEFDAKYNELKNCEKKLGIYKIAAPATLAVTAGGIYANKKLSEKLNKKSGNGGGDINRDPPPDQDDNLKELCDEMGNPSPDCDGI